MDNNAPTLMTSEEEKAPWNQNSKNVEVVVCITYAKTINMQIPVIDGEEDYSHIEDELREYDMLPNLKKEDWEECNLEYEIL